MALLGRWVLLRAPAGLRCLHVRGEGSGGTRWERSGGQRDGGSSTGLCWVLCKGCTQLWGTAVVGWAERGRVVREHSGKGLQGQRLRCEQLPALPGTRPSV